VLLAILMICAEFSNTSFASSDAKNKSARYIDQHQKYRFDK
jgi:hypothetical protein